MTQPTAKLTNMSRGSGDRLIRAMVPHGNVFSPMTFSETEVEGVIERGADRSALVLRSVAEITVALAYKDLEQKIYSPNIRTDDSSVLDLRAVTGKAARSPMPDGTVYAGVSPDTGKALYAMPADGPLTYTFKEAQKDAETTNTQKPHGHNDWRLPSKAELNVLFNNRAAIGGFNVSGSSPAGWYWSATPGNRWGAWCQRLSDGIQGYDGEDGQSSVRVVRGG